MLSVATIYWERTAGVATDGLQSSLVCDEALNTAKSIAKTSKRRVVVEDSPAKLCYSVWPNGTIHKPPKVWIPVWLLGDEETEV